MPGRRPMPEHYLHGPRGDRTIPTPHTFVSLLASTGVLEQLRSLVNGTNAELDAVLVAYMLAARERRGTGAGTVSAPTPEPAKDLTQRLTTRAAADRMNIGTRAITRAINEKRLIAAKDAEGRWWIEPQELDRYRRDRATT